MTCINFRTNFRSYLLAINKYHVHRPINSFFYILNRPIILGLSFFFLKISNVTNLTDSDEMPHLGLLIIFGTILQLQIYLNMGKCNDLESASEFINRHNPLVVPFDNGVCPGLTSDHDQRG